MLKFSFFLDSMHFCLISTVRVISNPAERRDHFVSARRDHFVSAPRQPETTAPPARGAARPSRSVRPGVHPGVSAPRPLCLSARPLSLSQRRVNLSDNRRRVARGRRVVRHGPAARARAASPGSADVPRLA